MSLTNSAGGYGWLTIALHWIAAIGVITMFVIGFNAHEAAEAGDRALRRELIGIHAALGVLLFLPLLLRVVIHYLQPQPTPVPQPRPFALMAWWTQNLLLVVILVLIASGPMAALSTGNGINVFGWFTLPSPFAERNQDIHEIAETVHKGARWVIAGLVLLHVAGALKHLLIDRDGAFQRMLAPK